MVLARSSHSRDWVVCTIDTNGLRSPEDRGRFLHTLCLCSVLARVGEAATSSRTSHGFFTQSNPRSPRIITSGRRDLVRPRVAGWSHSGEPQERRSFDPDRVGRHKLRATRCEDPRLQPIASTFHPQYRQTHDQRGNAQQNEIG